MVANFPDVVLTDFRTIEIAPKRPQEMALRYFALALAKAICVRDGIVADEEADETYRKIAAKVEKYGVGTEYISQRQGVNGTLISNNGHIPDRIMEGGKFVDLKINSITHPDLFRKDANPRGIPLEERMASFEKICAVAIRKAYDGCDRVPDDIIHVSCSGYISPSPAEVYASKRNWHDTTITHSYHMGCYGCLPAVRMAHGFLASAAAGAARPKKRVDILHTEILSMHYDLLDDSAENIVTSTLFGDGFVKYSAVADGDGRHEGGGMKVLALREQLLPDSIDDMTWKMGAMNFHMTLSINVPLVIKRQIRHFVGDLLAQIGMGLDDLKNGDMAFAIHPGGPRIVDYICDELDLSESQVFYSRKIFQENGNISSATIPFILSEMCRNEDVAPKTRILCLAFGPGLTAAGMLLEKT